MPAVGVEGGEGRFRRLRAAQIEPGLAVLVADHELAADVEGAKDDDQRGEHPRHLLGIAMAGKEAALVAGQKLVERRGDRFGHAWTFGYAGDNGLQSRSPGPAADSHLIRVDLPGRPHKVSTRVCSPRP
jgi:hypothetical protein